MIEIRVWVHWLTWFIGGACIMVGHYEAASAVFLLVLCARSLEIRK